MNTPPRTPNQKYHEVELRQSPLAKQGNLTGTPRKVRDNVADLYNLIQKWNSILIDSYPLIDQIYESITKSWEVTETSGPALLYKADPKVIAVQDALELSRRLDTVCSKLSSVMTDMGKITKSFTALCKLEAMKQDEVEPVFLTWPMSRYDTMCREIHEAYNKEYICKRNVLRHIFSMKTDDQVQTFCAMWKVSCYVGSRETSILEAMLKETGHK